MQILTKSIAVACLVVSALPAVAQSIKGLPAMAGVWRSPTETFTFMSKKGLHLLDVDSVQIVAIEEVANDGRSLTFRPTGANPSALWSVARVTSADGVPTMRLQIPGGQAINMQLVRKLTAEDRARVDIAWDPCAGAPQTVGGLNTCYQGLVESADKELMTKFGALVDLMSQRQGEPYRRDIVMWDAQRKSSCGDIKAAVDENDDARVYCYYRMTRAKAAQYSAAQAR